MANIFNQILIYPLLNLLVFCYHYIPDIGIVIILITILVRLLLLPSFHKSLKQQKAMAELQPKMNEVKEKYKDDKEGQAKALMELYATHKVNPLSSCLPLLIQLPILIALYQVFIRSLNGSVLHGLYKFVNDPGHINPIFLHWINLSHPNIIMAVIAGVLQYFQSRLMLPKTPTTDATTRMMQYQTLYFLPGLTILFGIRFPAGLTLYWIVTTLFGIAQQYFLIRKDNLKVLNGSK
ncbi:MAG TPA: YidC/Oxa1 family membrane protein insertase [Methylomirabilota bacterium]|nr:YidC/Oxa1 family membrane protein insertase [Methylomirabilota bacterium]